MLTILMHILTIYIFIKSNSISIKETTDNEVQSITLVQKWHKL